MIYQRIDNYFIFYLFRRWYVCYIRGEAFSWVSC